MLPNGSNHHKSYMEIQMATNNSTQFSLSVKDETGNVYGKLTVIRYAETRKGLAHWLCRCECGNMTAVAGSDIRKGSTVSCGCHRARAGGACSNGKRTPEYRSWQEMKRRCYNPNYPDYHLYGGRGITVCERWRELFLRFLADMGPKPFPEATIDRYPDQNGPYSPDNCRWASKMEQSQNSRKARMLTYNGETMCLRAWARKLGITHRTLSVRLAKDWPLDKVFSSEHYFSPPPRKKALSKSS